MLRYALRRHTGRSFLICLVLALGVLGSVPLSAPAQAASVPPIKQRTSTTVTTDALPTVQINGVIYAQVVVGNVVYAAGEFTSARPAGAKAGTDEVRRDNILAYDLTTGELISSFAPRLNGKVNALAISADETTVYAVGAFTKVGKITRNRFAAFNSYSGTLQRLNPSFNSTVSAIAVTPRAIYVGGAFTTVGTSTRIRLAAINPLLGSPTAWAPTADATVKALVPTPDQTKIVIGGSFSKLNTTAALGMGAVDAKTGNTRPWKINQVVKDYGSNAAILTLTADEDTVYGGGFAYGGGNFEGVFAASPTDGSVRWLQDCHGDTYDVASSGGVVYSAGHAHYCTNIGGFPDTKPRKAWYRGLAATKTVGGTVAKNGQVGTGYGNFAGNPAPSLINWFPDFEIGTYTGQSQGPWEVTATSAYVLYGGEFTKVNGKQQQGLVRMARPADAPRAQGPMVEGAETAPTASAVTTTSATLSWMSNWDRDDSKLTYELFRDGASIRRQTAQSQFWNRPVLSFVDEGLAQGQTYSYQVKVSDDDGNSVESPVTQTATAP